MKYLNLPDATGHILPFYLAMEEYAARCLPAQDYFFMWQVEPTVIFGRNQHIDSEVNVAYCREHGIATYRRKSGGGCVYADRDNIMMSYITPTAGDVPTTFARYTRAVVDMLRLLGLNASDNGRNDILVDGLKVSGNAFYHLPGRSIVHGTMLYDTDMEHMARAITPSQAKLASKGVASVRSRITTLCRHLPEMTIDEFMAHARRTLCDGEVTLTPADVKKIDALTQPYLEPSFISGHNRPADVVRRARIDNVGDVEVRLDMRDGIIAHASLKGDFFALADTAPMLRRLEGNPLEHDALADALADVDMSRIVMNLTNEQFINLITINL